MTPEQHAALQGTSSICLLVKIDANPSRGGDQLRIALNSRKITFEGDVYIPVPVEVSEQEITAGMNVDNATFHTVLQSTMDRLNLSGGKWQGAKVQLIKVDFLDLSIGAIERFRGRFGLVTLTGKEGEFEYQGNMRLLSQPIGDKTSHLCRHKLGGPGCTKDLTAFTFTGSVTAVTNNQKFTISVVKSDGYFYRGEIQWTSGANNGLKMEVQGNAAGVITLFQPMYKPVSISDTFIIIAGDDKTLPTCHGKFNNAINFGGEPDCPTSDKLFIK